MYSTKSKKLIKDYVISLAKLISFGCCGVFYLLHAESCHLRISIHIVKYCQFLKVAMYLYIFTFNGFGSIKNPPMEDPCQVGWKSKKSYKTIGRDIQRTKKGHTIQIYITFLSISNPQLYIYLLQHDLT